MLLALDANIFIYSIEDNRLFGSQALHLLKTVELGRVKAVASELVYLETLSDAKLRPTDMVKINQFLELSGTIFWSISKEVILEAARLRRSYNLKTPDAIHLANAIWAKASHFVTNDQQLIKQNIQGVEMVSLNHAAAILDKLR